MTRRNLQITCLAGWAVLAVLAWGQTARAHPLIPGQAPSSPVLLRGASVHPVSSPSLAKADLLLHQGKIVQVAETIEPPQGAQVIDVGGKHIYPGLIESFSNIGLVEIDAVRATRDEREAGDLNPNAKAWVAINPDSELIPVARSNGVLLALAAPVGGLIAGQSAVVQLDGWTFEEMTLRPAAALHVEWPRMSAARRDEESREAAGESRDRALRRLREAIADAQAYLATRKADPSRPVDARWEAMAPALSGQQPLIVAAEELPQIQAAVALAQEHRLNLIIYGGYDAELCAPLLKSQDVAVIVAGTHRLPLRRADAYDAAFTLPERLRAAGVRYCISGAGRFGASNLRNLPYHAATAAAFGLSREEALKAITLYPAQILGVADRVGSLEAGKDATLIVTSGDPLETATQVEQAFIQGRPVDLNDRHKMLWRKYQQKYGFGP